MKLIATAFTVGAAFAALATTTSVETLALDEDKVIDVAFGDRYVIDAITGSDAYTLTKTGAGVLQIGYCENPNARIVVSGGTLEARIPLVPSIAADAFFHVDASLSSTITSTESQGTNLVSQWTDVRGDGHPYATDIGKHQPYLTANYLNGRTVMDFGSFYGGPADGDTRWGAAMVWSEGTTSFKELFTVAMDTEDLKFKSSSYGTTNGKRAGVWIGYKTTPSTIDFVYRGNRTAVDEGQDPSGASNAPILNSGCKWASSARVAIDGVATGYSFSTPYPDGMHVLSLANTTTRAGYADRFASERGNTFGGIRMGETLVFTKTLTDAERTTIETYLQKKWLTGVFSLARLEIGEGCALRLPQGGEVTAGEYLNNGVFEGPGTVTATTTLSSDLNLTADTEITVEAGQMRVIRNLTGGAFTLTKKGTGKLVIEYCNSDAINVTAEAGTLEIRRNNAPAALSYAALHVDASLTNGFTISEEEGVSYVTAWPDVRGTGYTTPTVPQGGNAPFLNVAYANGRTVMDFGTLYNNTYQSGWGATMRFGESIYPVEVFMVAGDNEEAKGCVDGTGGAEHRNNTLFGHTSSSNPIFRGNGATGEACEIINSSSDFNRTGALCTLDGERVTAKATRLKDGLHVIGYSFTDADYLADPASFGLEIDSFACERTYEKGGLRIAEYIIFTNAISSAERELVADYLTDRWTKPLALGRLEVAAGATLSLPDGDRLLSVESVINGTVTGSGTVKSMSRNLGTVDLKADTWIDVPLGEIAVIDKVTNVYGYAIVKTGLGKLVIADSVNEKARLLVKEGEAVLGKSGQPVSAVLGEIELAEGTTLTVADGSSWTVGLLTDDGGTVSGSLTTGAVANGSGITVTRGDVVLDPLAKATAFFHVDAAKTNSILISSTAPTNVVCWSDVRGRRAKDGGDKPTDSGNFGWTYSTTAKNMPNWGGDGFTQNGLPVMDFGNVCYSTQSGDPYKCFVWDQGCWEVRDFILVVGDNENVKALDGKTDSTQNRNQAFLGHIPKPGGAIGPNSVMARGNRTQGSASPYILSGVTLETGVSFACDGVAVSEPKSDIFPDGMHVLSGSILESKVTSSNVYFNTFARERGVVFGGQRIGEALIFDHALTAGERAEYTDLLLTKWFGSNAVVRTHAAVSVPTNATLSLPNQALAVTTSLTLGGTISAVSVAAPSTITVSGRSGVEVKGKLTLPASGTFVLGDSWKTAGGGKHLLLAASDITYAGGGSIANWSATLPAGSRSSDPALSQKEDGIYVTTECGLLIFVK